jgi:hypothetical protein
MIGEVDARTMALHLHSEYVAFPSTPRRVRSAFVVSLNSPPRAGLNSPMGIRQGAIGQRKIGLFPCALAHLSNEPWPRREPRRRTV